MYKCPNVSVKYLRTFIFDPDVEGVVRWAGGAYRPDILNGSSFVSFSFIALGLWLRHWIVYIYFKIEMRKVFTTFTAICKMKCLLSDCIKQSLNKIFALPFADIKCKTEHKTTAVIKQSISYTFTYYLRYAFIQWLLTKLTVIWLHLRDLTACDLS